MAWRRDTPWRQGSVIAARDAVSLGVATDDDTSAVGVVASHDCDLAVEDLAEEPDVEVLIGRKVEKANDQLTFAKHPRRLSLEFAAGTGVQHVELLASRKMNLRKNSLAIFVPDSELTLAPRGQ